MKEKLLLKWALVAGIVIVLNLFFNYAISVFYDSPDWDAFCGERYNKGEITEQNRCTEEGGRWTTYAEPQRVTYPSKTNSAVMEERLVTGYCDMTYYCAQEYNDARGTYNRTVFIILVVLGVLSLLIGVFVPVSSAVSLGLSYGGVLSFIIASMRYWGDANDIVRLLILAIALAALIALGIKKFKD